MRTSIMTQNSEKIEKPDTRILPQNAAASPVSQEITCSSVGKMLHEVPNLTPKTHRKSQTWQLTLTTPELEKWRRGFPEFTHQSAKMEGLDR